MFAQILNGKIVFVTDGLVNWMQWQSDTKMGWEDLL